MLLIPIIELKQGKCAQPLSGMKTAGDDPVRVARHWLAAGARRLHLVDLDSDAGGKPVNAASVADIVAACDGVPVQVAAGIRSEENAEAYFNAGAEFLVLGTRAVSAPHLVNDLCMEYPGHIMVSLDIRDGRLAAEGWSKHANHDVVGVAEHFHREGVAAVVCNSMKDANAVHADPDAAVTLAHAVAIPVIVADGLASLDQIKRLCSDGGGALGGAMLGRALYAGKLDFDKAQKLADSLSES
ncbi:MAG TPA: HisA/HisF-related TIM barrel protein [Gammaproteobacteria bacterium]|jgi:phosphoribosylformimino-5-aminoimidazole carboxamide ribotide isomerase|nr:HisA/HisF-related TIM barrel protein [Gammaproteobacteria bacterium]